MRGPGQPRSGRSIKVILSDRVLTCPASTSPASICIPARLPRARAAIWRAYLPLGATRFPPGGTTSQRGRVRTAGTSREPSTCRERTSVPPTCQALTCPASISVVFSPVGSRLDRRLFRPAGSCGTVSWLDHRLISRDRTSTASTSPGSISPACDPIVRPVRPCYQRTGSSEGGS